MCMMTMEHSVDTQVYKCGEYRFSCRLLTEDLIPREESSFVTTHGHTRRETFETRERHNKIVSTTPGAANARSRTSHPYVSEAANPRPRWSTTPALSSPGHRPDCTLLTGDSTVGKRGGGDGRDNRALPFSRQLISLPPGSALTVVGQMTIPGRSQRFSAN